jgi:phage gpG-like protein
VIKTEFDGASVVARLDAMPGRVRDELYVGITRLAIRLGRNVQKDKLSGQVLNVRSGRLRRSIGHVVEVNTNIVAGIVSTPVVYAPPHEYGFQGTVNIKAHLREIKQAFGRPITARAVQVNAHSREVKLPERSFLRTALREMEAAGLPRDEIDAALKRAIA